MRGEARYISAAAWPQRGHEPGSRFNYNTVDAALVGAIIEKATGEPINAYMARKLWQPAGMERYGFYVLDGAPGQGQAFTGGGFNAVLRDFGRIGLLMLNEGVANGQRLLPAEWIRLSTAESEQPDGMADLGLGYAYLWWTLKDGRAYAALGGEGQFIFIDPASETVVVKMSHAPVGPEGQPIAAETFAFLRAVSRWQPAR